MTKLTDTQAMLLAAAAQRRDGAVTLPEHPPAARGRIAQALLRRSLVEEVDARRGMPVWRRDDQDRALSLTITPAGLVAINADETPPALDDLRPSDGSGQPEATRDETAVLANAQPAAIVQVPRERSKIAGVIALLTRGEGASADELVADTGWLPHTMRAALTGLRKRGYVVQRAREHDRGTVYRLAAPPVASAA